MSKGQELQKAVYGSDKTPLIFGAVEIPCYILEDGTRVLSRSGIQKAIGYTGRSGEMLTRLVTEKNGFPADIVAGVQHPIPFKRLDAGGSQPATNGHDALLFIDICNAIIDLNRAGVLNETQQQYAYFADVIVRSVAKVGIVALIDEVTGYQQDVNRAKNELQLLLSKLLLSEQAKWIKTFPDEFFEMIFKMKRWDWTKAAKKPQVIGHYINDFVYSRIAPVLLDELKRKNPVIEETGNRRSKHHQWLTPDLGHPKLKEHLAGVMALGRASGYDWVTFLRMLDRSYPKFGHTMKILFPGEDLQTKTKKIPQSEFGKLLGAVARAGKPEK